MNEWLESHIHGTLIVIEVLWVAGFFAVFVIYFLVKRHVKTQKATQQQLPKHSDQP